MHNLPYVYKLTNKNTGEFYIGSRWANKVNSSKDLGIFYFTSSKKIKKHNFSDYDSEIIAEFYDKNDAFLFEQELIKENWKNDLMMNLGRQGNSGIISRIHEPWSEEIKRKIGISNTGKKKRPRTEEEKQKSRELCLRLGLKPPNQKGILKTEEHKKKIGISNKGKRVGEWDGHNNPKYGKGDQLKGINNPNSNRWILIDTKTGNELYIDDLVEYCNKNNLKYSTVYGWSKKSFNDKQVLRKRDK